jgi:hypothetical protein
MVDISKLRVSEKMNAFDREALERCLRIVLADKTNDGWLSGAKAHVERVLAEENWCEAAELACFRCQAHALSLKPWQIPPCDIHPDDLKAILARGDDGVGGRYFAAKLLKQLFEADLSQYEPDPIRALEARKRPPAA